LLVVHFPDVDPCDLWVLDLKAVAIVPRGPLQAEAPGEGFFQVLGDDRGDGTDVLVVAERVRGAPFNAEDRIMPILMPDGLVGAVGRFVLSA
jgi:hypothetical protein